MRSILALLLLLSPAAAQEKPIYLECVIESGKQVGDLIFITITKEKIIEKLKTGEEITDWGNIQITEKTISFDKVVTEGVLKIYVTIDRYTGGLTATSFLEGVDKGKSVKVPLGQGTSACSPKPGPLPRQF